MCIISRFQRTNACTKIIYRLSIHVYCIYIVFKKILQVFDEMLPSPAENNEIMFEPPVVLIILK